MKEEIKTIVRKNSSNLLLFILLSSIIIVQMFPPDKSGEHNAFRSEMPGANAPLYACNRSQTLLFASKAECCSDLNHSTDVPPINQENITHFVPKYSELAIKVQLFFSLISLENILNFVK